MATGWLDVSARAFNGDYNGYIRYANQVLNISGAATEESGNGLRVFNRLPAFKRRRFFNWRRFGTRFFVAKF